MNSSRLTNEQFGHLIHLQIAESVATDFRSRPLAERLKSRTLLQHALLMIDVLRIAEFPCDGRDTARKLDAAIEKLSSTKKGLVWISERLTAFE